MILDHHSYFGNMRNISRMYGSSVNNLDLSYLHSFLEWDFMMVSEILIHKFNACCSAMDQGMCGYLLVIQGQCAGYN